MRTLRSHTGYLMIDHSESPGITIDDVPERLRGSVLVVGKGEVLERDTKSCSHCERQVILEPLRTRDRGLCPYCHHYICDECDTMLRITGQCIPFKSVLDKAWTRLMRNPDDPLITLTDAWRYNQGGKSDATSGVNP